MINDKNLGKWAKIQRLTIDIAHVQRHHYILGTDRHENVAEHSFSVAVLCLYIFDIVKPPLDLNKILKYALLHDFTERGLKVDFSAFDNKKNRKKKVVVESEEMEKINKEFADFTTLLQTLKSYDEREDEESLFVWSIDKMQPIILGYMDDWRPYSEDNISFASFCEKYDMVYEKCSPYVKDIFKEVYEKSKKTYYDKP